MFTRTFIDNNEYSSYPLVDGHYAYPEGLISGINLITDTDDFVGIYLHAVTITENTINISIVMGDSTADGYVPYCYGSCSRGASITTKLYSHISGDPVGWVTFGTLSDIPARYSGMARISDDCIITRPNIKHPTIMVNDISTEITGDFHIRVSGDLISTNGYISNGNYEYSSDLSDVNLDDYGSIITVNENIPDDGYIHIKLPSGPGSSGSPIFEIITGDPLSGVTQLIIQPKKDAKNSDLKEFSCPDSDILLDIIEHDSKSPDISERPLDAFILWYKDKYRDSGDEQ